MKQIYYISALSLSLLLGTARAVDLILNTEAETGFLRSGSVLPRYLLMLLCVLLILLAGRPVPLGRSCGLRPEDKRWMHRINALLIPLAFCSELYGFLFLLNRFFGLPVQISTSRHAMDHLGLYYLQQFVDGACAALFVIFGIWCLLLFFENFTRALYGRWMLALGTLSSTVFYLQTILRFIERPSSLYRIIPVADILSALAALLFVTALLRALYLPDSAHAARALCRSGLFAFFFCTCLALPQTIWQYARHMETVDSLILAAAFGLLGLTGAACAGSVSGVQPDEEE